MRRLHGIVKTDLAFCGAPDDQLLLEGGLVGVQFEHEELHIPVFSPNPHILHFAYSVVLF